MRYGVRVNKISSKYRDRKAAPFHRRPQNYARRIARVLLSSPFSSRILLGIIEYLSPDLRRPSILSFREHLYAGPKSSHIIERSEELRRSLYSINCFGNAPVNERLADCDNYIIFALVNFNLSFSTLTEVASHRFKAEKKALFFIYCFHTYTKIKRETPAWIDTLQLRTSGCKCLKRIVGSHIIGERYLNAIMLKMNMGLIRESQMFDRPWAF